MIYKKVNLPDDLSDITLEYIKSVIDYLKKNDKLNTVDNGTIHLLATSYDQYLKATELVNEQGLVIPGAKNSVIPHPGIRIAKDAKSMCLNLMTAMGLTLKSRTKLNQIDPDTEDTPLTELMKSML